MIKSKEYQEWMEAKGHAKNIPLNECSKEKRLVLRYSSRTPEPCQMEIGYMIEYLIYKKATIEIDFCFNFAGNYEGNINEVYEDLKQKIEHISK